MTGCGILYNLGAYFYFLGYADDSLDVETARYKKGGAINRLGLLGAMIGSVSAAGSFNGWW